SCLVHIALGWTLIPHWMFSKYPDAAALFNRGLLRAEQSADFSPLYLLMNIVLPPGALRIAQSLLGCVSIVAVFFASKTAFGRIAALASSVLLAVAVPWLLYEATLEPDSLVGCLNAIGLALLLMACSGGRLWIGALAGIAVGASAALRPTALIFLTLSLCG